MDKAPKSAIRWMMIYVSVLLVLGLAAGAAYTIYGHPADQSEKSAAETLPANGAAPQ